MSQTCGQCKKSDTGRRYAWRAYYQLLNEQFELAQKYTNLLGQIQEIESKNNFELPAHFKEEMITCLKELECPVCLDAMTKETFNYTSCFHKVCKICVEAVKTTTNKCPICRKKL
jgi:hypothetical protein